VQKQKALFMLAIDQFQSAVAINPNNAEAKRHWGWEIDRLALHEKDASKKAQMHRDSLDLLEAALKIDPFSADTWDNKGRALRALDRDGDALVAFKRCTEICPNHLQAWGALGELHAKAARWPEAERCFRKAISISPKNAISVWKLGKMFQQQAAFGPKGPEQQRLFRLAANTHTEAINLDANNAKFFADCGYCLSRNGDVVQARRMIERGLNIDPDHKDCKKNLTYLNNNKK
jgi:tetratricopeptide (TPR) repeat protein